MASLLCSKCLKIKDEALFYRDIKLKRGFSYYCKDCECACCDIIFTKDRNYTIDHIIPLVKGGGLCLENVQLLCTHCNCSKGIKEIQYRPDINYLVKE